MTPKHYSHIGRKKHALDPSHWEERYRTGETPWDHGEPSPGLVDFLAQEKYTPGKAIVPGCGRGRDCVALARHGFAVTGVDVSALAIQGAQKLAAENSVEIDYHMRNFLHPPRSWRGAYDWVVEHTCFCAIDPDLRDDYVQAVRFVLKRGGHLLGVFFNIEAEEGPPFGATRGELADRFGPHFDQVTEKVPRSFPNREGEELLVLWRKK